MKTDGIFTLKSIEIPVTVNQPIRLIPFGDVHWDSDLCARDRWEEFCGYASSREDAYFLGMGDYLDSWSTSERETLKRGGFHDTSINGFERDVRARVDKFARTIKFMRGRTLGMIGGNHRPEFRDGTNGDQILAGLLDTSYLGVCSLLELILRGKRKTDVWILYVYAHHGKGGSARLAGGSMNTVAYSAEYVDADILLMGHDHKRGVLPLPPLLRPSRSNIGTLVVKERQRYIGRTGSFLKAYVDGKASYNVDAARGPSSLGHIEFEITPRRYCRKGAPDQTNVLIRGIA